ncbi:TIGR03885 family FMN-dependent LLM class oxidoreductase [Miltoncostaea marina]|uniref:TIGR03885 family FMN-dependent LLM class oxidoreductase n=1 Tax=Miltoncostaea marina TaxID=2843215 RepID=UPI001C3D0453|nr:TIGR03885 family FMN-dependent LLM class oxidoreductase [Miltoncostaea marina]
MAGIGWHASHEQIAPSRLLEAARLADAAGFDFGMSSDHLAPWGADQGHSGFAWSWLGAALAVTRLPFRVVTAPGQRYHPAVLAQAIATLEEMSPGRLAVCLGSGEAANEHVTGEGWPAKPVRNARLLECADVIRRLLTGEEVSHRGLVTVDRARVWSLPPTPPPLFGAAVSEATARWLGGWADGLATVNQAPDTLRRVLAAFREGGGEGKPALLQVHVSWERTDEEALRVAHHQWRSASLGPPASWDLETPEHFDAAARFVRPEDMHASVLISADLGRHAQWLAELAAIGFDEVAVHGVSQDQAPFIEAFGAHVLPALR